MMRLIILVSFWLMLCCALASQAQERNRGGRSPHEQPRQTERTKDDVRGQPAHHVAEPAKAPHESHPLPPPCPAPTPVQVCIVHVPPPVECVRPCHVVVEEVEEFPQVVLRDCRRSPAKAGYDFSEEEVLSYDDANADMYFESSDTVSWMKVRTDTDIQDLGAVESLSQVDDVPKTPWADNHLVNLSRGRAYVVWTWDNQFVKFRVTALSSDRVAFEWAYLERHAMPYSSELIRDGRDRPSFIASKFVR